MSGAHRQGGTRVTRHWCMAEGCEGIWPCPVELAARVAAGAWCGELVLSWMRCTRPAGHPGQGHEYATPGGKVYRRGDPAPPAGGLG